MSEKEFDVREHFKKIPVLDKGYVELIDGMVTHPLLKIVNAARVSFLKAASTLDAKEIKLINFLKEHEHTSPFRHTYFTFRIKAPLCIFRQWWKYQIASEWIENENVGSIEVLDTSWNEASGRFVVVPEEFYIPEVIRRQSTTNKQGSEGKVDEVMYNDMPFDPVWLFQKACSDQYETYKAFIASGAAREQARMLLPQNIYSECVWTCSLQTVLWFLHQRLKPDAQQEISLVCASYT